jgi:hypothetical protein
MKMGRLLLVALMTFGVAGLGAASEIQCKRILKYLSTGRTPSDVAETMVISEDEVLACQEEAKAAEGEGGDAEKTDGDEAKE